MTAYVPRTAVITGASGDFGRTIAQRFAAVGTRLVLAGRRRERLEALAKELDVPVHLAVFDVRDRAGVDQALGALPADFAEVDLLVNNAGLALGADPAPQSSLEDWEEMIDTNVKGLVYCTHRLLPGMAERRHGHIVNLGSVAGSYPYPGGHVYCATKAFVKQFSLALRADLNAVGVRVTDIEPGMVQTDFSLVRFKGDEERAAKVYANTVPMTADDVAEAVFWCATLSPHVNINRIEVMPTVQAPGPLAVHRTA